MAGAKCIFEKIERKVCLRGRDEIEGEESSTRSHPSPFDQEEWWIRKDSPQVSPPNPHDIFTF